VACTDHAQVLIVGAGFGGLWAARAFAHSPADVLVLDRNNYHTFLPLLYQVGAAELEPEDIVYPVRSILRRYSNVRYLMSEVTGIDLTARQVKTSDHTFSYDYLILAVGSAAHFFGIEGAADHSFQLKTLEQAIGLRNHILSRFEGALCESDATRRQQMLTFAIVGGGPTGVELAGALAELVRGPLVRDYPALDFQEVHILLLEATDHLLSNLPARLQTYALARLRRMGVEVHLQATVKLVTPQAVTLLDGRMIPLETVIWTAGVRGESLGQSVGLPTRRNGQVNVLPTLQVPGHSEVYCIGDLAHPDESGEPLPLVAPVAIQEGEWTARNILRQLQGQQPLPFHYRDPGTMVTLGRNAAAVQLGRHTFTGFPAWVLWLSVHLFKLIGFRNRMLVLINWAWDYLFYERTVRLIMNLPGERILPRK
jgi:NADH dehydrogenase